MSLGDPRVGTDIGISGFGLPPLKREGACYIDHKEVTKEEYDHYKAEHPSTTRWIELCYDSEEDMSNALPIFDTISQMIDFNLVREKLFTEDDAYLLIKALANKYV